MALASFMPFAIGFCVALAAFLLGCAITALLTEPSHDALDESVLGDLPWVGDYEPFHARCSATEGQR